MDDKFTPKEIYYMSLTNQRYIDERTEWLNKITKEHLVDQDKIERQVAAVLQGLKNEQKRLEDYQSEKCMRYYAHVAEDYKKWKRTTGQN